MMDTIGDFSSVFEVGFAVNALLQYLEIDPAHRSRLHLLVSAIDELRGQCKENSVEHLPVSGDISTEWAFQWISRMQRQLWQRLTIVMSLVALALLIWGAYFPTTAFPWWLSIPVIAAQFVVPLKAYLSCKQIEQALEDNLFSTADVLGIDAKAFLASKDIIPKRPSDL
jgi:hypothetical protein